MHCSEWWCFEIMAIAAGWIGNDALAAQSIILNTCGLSYMLPLGVSVAAGTRTGNILGSNEPDSARVSSRAALSLGLLFASFNFMFYLSVKDFWGKLWLDNDNVTNIISQILPLIAVFQLSDGLNCVAGGILRGCGEQRIGASVNFIGYYGLGIPLSLVLAFYYNLGLFGLWIGVSLAVVLVSFFEVLIILRLDWKAQAKKAQDRLELENSEEEPLISE